jgi:hypothetical protein
VRWIFVGIAFSAVTASAQPAIRLTARQVAACGPDQLERHATNAADLDGDGTLDRVSIVREHGGIVVRLHQLPTLRETASWTLQPANGYVEVATPRRRASQRGDLWIRVGHDAAGGWKQTLYHLANGKLAQVATGYSDLQIRVDVDGDGRVDPIVSIGGKVRALRATGAWLDLPAASVRDVHGAPLAHGQEEAVDLDGNGTRELVINARDELVIVEVPGLRRSWSVKGKTWKPRLVAWRGALVLAAQVDDKLQLYSALGAPLGELGEAASYSEVSIAGGQLLLSGHPWHVYDRGNPTTSIGTLAPLAPRLDRGDHPAAAFGPVRVAAGEAAGWVALVSAPGSPTELVLLDPVTRRPRRTIWRPSRQPRISDTITARLIDLDGDGTSEILLEEVTRTAFHHGASWNTMRMTLIDGRGTVLWHEPQARTDRWVHEGAGLRGPMRQVEVDGTAVRAIDLGDATRPLRIRSARDEYYLLPARSKLRQVPVCLE